MKREGGREGDRNFLRGQLSVAHSGSPGLQGRVQPREASLGPTCRTHLVVQQAGGVSEPLGAGGAAVGPLAGVRAQVVGQVEAVLEAFAAARTRVRFERGVPSEVAPQVRAVAEALATLTAVKRDAGGNGGRSRGRDRGRWQRGVIHGGVVRGQWRVGALSGAGRHGVG